MLPVDRNNREAQQGDQVSLQAEKSVDASSQINIATPVTIGSSYPLFAKMLAIVIFVYVLYYAVLTIPELVASKISTSLALFLGLAFLMMLLALFHVLLSQTKVSTHKIEQGWGSFKSIEFANVSQAKLLRVPGLGFLIAPRLVVKVSSFESRVFQLGDKAVYDRVLKEFRGLMS